MKYTTIILLFLFSCTLCCDLEPSQNSFMDGDTHVWQVKSGESFKSGEASQDTVYWLMTYEFYNLEGRIVDRAIYECRAYMTDKFLSFIACNTEPSNNFMRYYINVDRGANLYTHRVESEFLGGYIIARRGPYY